MERFDAVVVGAGPAGSVAAYRLAAAGARTLLLDKASFPRDKPCGGGVTGRALRLLPFSIDPVVEDVIVRAELTLGYAHRFGREARAPICWMTQRRRLDAYLVERAVEAGAEFRDGVRVHDRLPVDARVVLGADGANGASAHLLGLAGDVVHGIALEGNVRHGDVDGERYRGTMVIELGVVPGGYGWVFPKGDHVNVGVGGWLAEGPRLREHLERLCNVHGIDPAAVEDARGHRLPMRRPSTRIANGNTALIGDAAGLVDPFSGDGMYEAFYSAKLAAAATLDVLEGRARTMEPYASAVARAIGPLTAAGWGAKVAVDRFPRATFAIMRLPVTWRAVEKLLRGELRHPGAARGAERAAVRLVYALARRAGDPGREFRPGLA
jgi:geranylgeranyl reductase family protein